MNPPDIIRQLKNVLDLLGYLSPAEDARQAERIVKTIIDQLKTSPQPQPDRVMTPTTIKPCWAAANQVYEWGIKRLPPSRHYFRDIHQAARTRADAPPVRIPSDVAAFAEYVRQFRRKTGLPIHRQMRASGMA